jgi:hypothetical protein
LFLIESSRSADAFVKYYLSKSLNLFYDNLETQTRKFWVPAPFRIEDKDIVSFSNNELTYVPGLTEIKSMLNPSRIIISIEGPGGVGKSSFAFQIARWGFDSNPVKRIQKHKIIPLFVNKLSQNLDEACKDKLQYIMNSTTISNSLYKSLLRNKRVLAVVDGISEINALSQDWIDAEKGAKEIQFVVYTSRKPLHFPESITIIPLGLKISYLDSLIDGFTNSYVGANKFEDEREVLRTRIKMILSEINKSDPDRPVPLVILRLMIQQASDLVDQGKHLSDELPNNLSSLFENYISDLLRNTDSPKEAERDLLKAAVVSMGLSELFNKKETFKSYQFNFKPQWVSSIIYDSVIKGDRKTFFINSGILIVIESLGDQQIKFANDPIGEYLCAKYLCIQFRDKEISVNTMHEILVAAKIDALSMYSTIITLAEKLKIKLPET